MLSVPPTPRGQRARARAMSHVRSALPPGRTPRPCARARTILRSPHHSPTALPFQRLDESVNQQCHGEPFISTNDFFASPSTPSDRRRSAIEWTSRNERICRDVAAGHRGVEVLQLLLHPSLTATPKRANLCSWPRRLKSCRSDLERRVPDELRTPDRNAARHLAAVQRETDHRARAPPRPAQALRPLPPSRRGERAAIARTASAAVGAVEFQAHRGADPCGQQHHRDDIACARPLALDHQRDFERKREAMRTILVNA